MNAKLRAGFCVALFAACGITEADSSKIQNPANDHWYQRFDTPMTWSNAQAYCQSLGGHLATITSEEENDFVYTNLGLAGQSLWLGASDAAAEGTWAWVTGEAWGYANWASGQPDNDGLGQDFLAYYNDVAKQWVDQGLPNDDTAYAFICEWTRSFELGLVAYYPFNGNANDASGNGNNGTLAGDATWTNGMVGSGALWLDGTNDYVSVPDSPSLRPSQYTISAWVWTVAVEGESGMGIIVTKPFYNSYNNDSYNFSLWKDAGSQGGISWPARAVGIQSYNNSHQAGYAMGTTSTPLGRWVHVAATCAGTEMAVFVNGVEQRRGAWGDWEGTIGYDSSAVTIGGLQQQGGVNWFHGAIDELRIYNRALSGSEIEQLYNMEVGLVAYYPFNGNANDASGNGNNGTPQNGAALAADRFGNANQAYSFDGSDDEIALSSEIPATTGDGTWCAWVKPAEAHARSVMGKNDTTTGYALCLHGGEPQRIFVGSGSGTTQAGWLFDLGGIVDRWTLLAVTKSGDTLTLFVDGVSQGTRQQSQVSAVSVIGGGESGVYHFHGSIDEVRIYNRALLASEVQQLADTDEDSLPDAWELQYFGNLAQTSGGDYDGDLDTNLQEYLSGQNPTAFDIGPMSIWTAVEVGWRSVSGTNYQVQWCSALETNTWYNLGAPIPGNGTTNTVLESTRGQEQRYYRVILAP